MTFAAPVQGSAIQPVESLSKFSFCLDIAQWRPRRGILVPGSGSCTLLMTRWASSPITRRAEELTARLSGKFRLTVARTAPDARGLRSAQGLLLRFLLRLRIFHG